MLCSYSVFHWFNPSSFKREQHEGHPRTGRQKHIVKLSLELETDRVSRAYEMACRQLSQQVRIPGFRPGKAPRMIIEKTVGEENIKRETLERLVPELINEAIYKENLDIITAPEYSNFEFKLGQPLKFDAKFEVSPEVVLGNYKEIEVNVPEVNLPEDAPRKELWPTLPRPRHLCKTVEGKAIEMGNTAVLDFECRVDGNIIDGGKAEGMLLEVKEGSFLPGFCEQLVGHNCQAIKFPRSKRHSQPITDAKKLPAKKPNLMLTRERNPQ